MLRNLTVALLLLAAPLALLPPATAATADACPVDAAPVAGNECGLPAGCPPALEGCAAPAATTCGGTGPNRYCCSYNASSFMCCFTNDGWETILTCRGGHFPRALGQVRQMTYANAPPAG